MRFVIDKATGGSWSHRTWTLGALAPSENIWRVPIRWRADPALKAGNTVVNGDDLYRALHPDHGASRSVAQCAGQQPGRGLRGGVAGESSTR